MSGRQLEFPHHVGKAPNLFDQRLERSRTKQHAKLRLALSVAGLAQGSRVLLPGCSRLLQLGLDL
jgi:hypothetical protein